ncbi:MAG TPA: response regulator [Deltaproteobacteria bacterium]|nr:response regulator [Deltaproteobacteria bacterium]
MSERKKILIIDDDRDYADALRIVLENNGYDVRHALNVTEGRSSIQADAPDLIILDVMMEKHTDGFDLCADLKNDDACRMIPIIMVTAVTEKTGFKFSPETDGEYLPADDYVSKPVAVTELLARVNRLLTHRGA